MSIGLQGSGGLAKTNISIGTGQYFTMSAWFRQTSNYGFYSGLLYINNSAGDGRFLTMTTDDGGTNVYIQSVGVTNNNSGTIFSLTIGEWIFVSLVKDGTSLRAYWRRWGDNKLSTATVASELNFFGSNIGLYFGSGDFNEFFIGTVSSGKIWNTALSERELLIESYFMTPKKRGNLWFYNPFLDRDSCIIDLSGNRNTLTKEIELFSEKNIPLSLK